MTVGEAYINILAHDQSTRLYVSTLIVIETFWFILIYPWVIDIQSASIGFEPMTFTY